MKSLINLKRQTQSMKPLLILFFTMFFGMAGESIAQIIEVAQDGSDGLGFLVDATKQTLLVGAPRIDSQTGKAVVYGRNGLGWTKRLEITGLELGLSSGDRLGNSVAIIGDNEVAIGAPFFEHNQDLGRVAIGHIQGDSLARFQILQDPRQGGPSFYGWSLAASADLLYVGATRDTLSTGLRTGAVYVYYKVLSDWHLFDIIEPPPGFMVADFGIDIAVTSGFLFVSAVEFDGTTVGDGIVFGYRIRNNHFTAVQALKATPRQPGNHFGHSIAATDSLLLVGATGQNLPSGNKGAAYIYETSGFTLVSTIDSDRTDNFSFAGDVSIHDSFFLIQGSSNLFDINDGAIVTHPITTINPGYSALTAEHAIVNQLSPPFRAIESIPIGSIITDVEEIPERDKARIPTILVYPQPARERMTVSIVDLELACYPVDIGLYDLTGKRVSSSESSSPKTELVVDHLARGLYSVTYASNCGQHGNTTVILQ